MSHSDTTVHQYSQRFTFSTCYSLIPKFYTQYPIFFYSFANILKRVPTASLIGVTCGKFSRLDMIWKVHTRLYKVPHWTVPVRAQTKHEAKGIVL